MALTKKRIDSLRFDGRPLCFFPDGPDGIPNFGIRVFPSGRKSFLLGYRLPGSRRQRWTTVGKYGVLTLHQAREKARKLLLGIQQGRDPKATAPAKVTLAEYADIYIADCKVRGVKTWKKLRSRLDRRIIPALGDHPMEDIKRQDCQRLHSTISASKGWPLVEANRCLGIVQAMFTRAELGGFIKEGAYNPVTGLDFHKEESRTRYLDQLELKRLEKAMKAEPLHVQCLIRLYLLLGFRKSELLSMPWAAVKIGHPEGDHIAVAMTKNGRDLKLALSPECVRIFQMLREAQGYDERTRDCEWVFPSRWEQYKGPVKDFRNYWDRLRKVANLRNCTVHDLRRTCGSIMIQNGVPLEFVSKVLNHADPAMTRVYARLSEDNQRDALAVASQVLEGIFGEIAA